jgi:CcmD family protein
MVMTKYKQAFAGVILLFGLTAAGASLASLALGPSVAAAQGAGEDSAEDRASAFRAVEGADAEQVPGGTLLLSAYGVMWLFIFGYVFRLQRMQTATQAEVSRLARVLESASPDDAEG